MSFSDTSTIAGTVTPETPPDMDYFYQQVIREDDYKGFELLFRHYYNTLCGYAMRYVTTREAAKDVVSEVFYRLWKNRASLDLQVSCRAYLFTSVRHQACNYLGREFRKDLSLEDTTTGGTAAAGNPEEILLYDELHNQLSQAIDSLSPQCRKVFLLSRYEGLKYHEIAERLQISPKAVEAQVSRALKMLRPLVRLVLLVFCLFHRL